MLIFTYARRALLRLPRRTFAGVFGTWLAIGLLSSVLLFVGASARGMTQHTIASVPVDLRAQALTYGLDMPAVQAWLRQQPGIVDAQRLTESHFSASSFGRDQRTFTTGPGVILAVDGSYFNAFPALRLAQGSYDPAGIVLSQDMGTNLGARVGDTITLTLPGPGSQYVARVTGIADMHHADELFAPTDARLAGVAFNPPANVVIMPLAVFDAHLAARLKAAPPPEQPLTTGGPTVVAQGDVLSVDQQVHLKINRDALSGDPTQAQAQTTQLRLALEKLYPGRLRVSDDLYRAIESVKNDVLWAQVLFVFLAIPGILLAAYLSRYAAEGLVESQRREFALLRARGASSQQVLGIVAAMSAAMGLLGSCLGLLAGAVTVAAIFGAQVFALAQWRLWGSALLWSLLAGLAIAGLSTYLPARRLLRAEVSSERRVVRRPGQPPLWMRGYLDVILLVAAAIVFRITQINGFHPVLNAEGNPTLSLSLYTFLAPLCFWIGAVLLLVRLASALLQSCAGGLGRFLESLYGQVGSYAAATTARRARAMSQAMIVVALALSFGIGVSIFASTYTRQQRLDAELTLGSDVKVSPAGEQVQTVAFNSTLAHMPGVAASTPFKATVAYVGTEIQDIFGVDVTTLRLATNLSDAFFRDSTAAATMDRLAATPDGILISDEMARDYSIVSGDHVTLRLFNRQRQAYQDAHFTVVGVALEFPTAPQDAFLVVNLPALAQATGDPAIGAFLVKAQGDPAVLAQSLQAGLPARTAQVQSIGEVAAKLATSLTSLNLSGLVGIEYAYTILIASAGLAVFLLALLAGRQREFATMRTLGATGRQLAAFIVSEAGLISLSGLIAGVLIGGGLAATLVVILTSIFDPPPAGPIPSVPPLVLLSALSLAAMALAVVLALRRQSRIRVSDALREQ